MKPSHFLTSDESSINSVPISDDLGHGVTRDVTKIINCDVISDAASSRNVEDIGSKVDVESAPIANENLTPSDATSNADVIDAIDVVSDNVESERSDLFEKVESEPRKK